ncbi:MAG: agmatine deiminase family protein [Candidatus Acidiferrum sp.]
MNKDRHRKQPPRLALLLLLLVLPAFSRAQTPPPPSQSTATDVVMLSLQALDPRAPSSQHVSEGLLGNSDMDLEVEKQLREIQMNIVRATAPFGPVLLLAPDETTKTAVYQRCKEFQICELFKTDRVRIKVVPHDGAWIRDFGPQIDAGGDSPYVVHWRYFDIRKEEAKREKFQEIETARLKLLEARHQEEQQDDFSQESSPEARKAVLSAIDAKLNLLREYSQILTEASVQRSNDENSAYDIADAVLAAPDFNFKSSPVALDGGNLLRLDDGRCLTTRVLLTRNKDQNVNLDQELEKIGGCKNVTYLEPLPGPVTEHIDMFALPVGGKKILLASYDLSKAFAAEYWNQLSNEERDLALNAALAMAANAEQLTRLGYEVLSVPSPFPRIPANGHIYYPTVLNALVRENAAGERQILVPSYKDYETDLQSSALNQIKAAFGPKADIVTIEATAAAKSQGAIHCLTLSAPLRLSIFSDSADAARRTAFLALKDQLDRNVASEIASQIPAAGLQGSWAILNQNEQSDKTPLDLYPQRIFFGEHEFQKGVLDRLESQGTYTIDSKSPASWSLHFRFADQSVVSAVVQWLNKDEVKLVLGDGDSTMLLKRAGSSLASPFKSAGQASPQTGEGTSAPTKNPAIPKKPTKSAPQPPVSLQPIQPLQIGFLSFSRTTIQEMISAGEVFQLCSWTPVFL